MNDIKQLVIRYSMIIMVVTFAIIVACAFLYKRVDVQDNMRNKDSMKNVVYEERESNNYYESDEHENASVKNETGEEQESDTISKERKKAPSKRFYRDYSVVDEIPEIEKQMTETKTEEFTKNDEVLSQDDKAFSKADELRHQNKYESAVYEYEKLALNTSDNITKARCYEEIANTYSSIRRYLSAIPFAKTSFDLNASERVRNLLIDLYIKTGNFEKADELTAVKVEGPEKSEELKNSENNNKVADGVQNLELIE